MRLLSAVLVAGLAHAAHAATGAELYASNCAMCHQANGIGAPGQYPPLKGRIDKIAASAEGKHYLADVLVYGMAGRIDAGGASYVGFMPSFRQLPDPDIAALLSWLASLGDSKPAPVIEAADIAAARANPLSSPAVAKERKALGAVHPLP